VTKTIGGMRHSPRQIFLHHVQLVGTGFLGAVYCKIAPKLLKEKYFPISPYVSAF
jgi:hypothetical protein